MVCPPCCRIKSGDTLPFSVLLQRSQVSRLGPLRKGKGKTTPQKRKQTNPKSPLKPNPRLTGSPEACPAFPPQQEVEGLEGKCHSHCSYMSLLNPKSTLPGTTPERDLGCCFLAVFVFHLFSRIPPSLHPIKFYCELEGGHMLKSDRDFGSRFY